LLSGIYTHKHVGTCKYTYTHAFTSFLLTKHTHTHTHNIIAHYDTIPKNTCTKISLIIKDRSN